MAERIFDFLDNSHSEIVVTSFSVNEELQISINDFVIHESLHVTLPKNEIQRLIEVLTTQLEKP